jgi:alkylhydroperoxidase family enzyme
MARIPYPDPASQSAEVRDRLQRIGSLNVTRMMSHAEGPMMAYSKLGTTLLLRGKLDPVLREIVILRIGQLCGSDYEWHQHVSVARAVGMDEATLQAVKDQDFATLTPPQQAAAAVAEEIKRNNGASAATFERARQFFSPEQLVELCLVAGYYIMTAGFLLSFDIEMEDGAPLGESLRTGASR